MTYPSSLFGKIHFLLLAIFLLLSVCVLINQLTYDLFIDFYYEYMSSFDDVIQTYQNDILIIAIVTYLVWLLRVHSSLRRIEPRYPINEFEYLLRMALPLIQIWGIASTFNQMSIFFARNPLIGRKAARLKIVVVFIYIFYLGTFVLLIVMNASWSGMLATYVSLVGFVLMYALFLLTTHWINKYLYICVQAANVVAPVPEGPARLITDRLKANIGARLAAKAIDVFSFIFLTITAIVLATIYDEDSTILFIAITWLIWFIYLVIHLSMNGQTLGKWLLKLKIVRIDTGAEGGFVHNVLLRMVANNVIGLITPFYSLVDMLFIFSKDARCIHDQLASTRVIKLRDYNEV